MKIDNLIWSRAVVTLDDDVLSTIQQHVQAVYHESTHLLHLRMFTSSQGTARDSNSLSYSYPELVSLDTSGMVLRAYTWGDKVKDKRVLIRLEF